jgi:hypothetical protein
MCICASVMTVAAASTPTPIHIRGCSFGLPKLARRPLRACLAPSNLSLTIGTENGGRAFTDGRRTLPNSLAKEIKRPHLNTDRTQFRDDSLASRQRYVVLHCEDRLR